MAAANTHRSIERSAGVCFRFTPEQRAELKRRAHEMGLTMQDYADLRLLDLVPQPRPSGRPPKKSKADKPLFDEAV